MIQFPGEKKSFHLSIFCQRLDEKKELVSFLGTSVISFRRWKKTRGALSSLSSCQSRASRLALVPA
jgi:hypothetical protein